MNLRIAILLLLTTPSASSLSAASSAAVHASKQQSSRYKEEKGAVSHATNYIKRVLLSSEQKPQLFIAITLLLAYASDKRTLRAGLLATLAAALAKQKGLLSKKQQGYAVILINALLILRKIHKKGF